MARIVYVKNPTDNAQYGDIISIHEDGTDLSGSGYASFEIKDLPGVSVEEVRKKLGAKIPPRQVIEAWQDINTGKLHKINERPKYDLNIADALDAKNIDDLAEKAKDNITTKKENVEEVVVKGSFLDATVVDEKAQIKQVAIKTIKSGTSNITSDEVVETVVKEGHNEYFTRYLLDLYMKANYQKGYIQELSWQAFVDDIQSHTVEELLARK